MGPELLGMELNNASCYRSVTKLYLEIQKGERATNKLESQHDIRREMLSQS